MAGQGCELLGQYRTVVEKAQGYVVGWQRQSFGQLALSHRILCLQESYKSRKRKLGSTHQ